MVGRTKVNGTYLAGKINIKDGVLYYPNKGDESIACVYEVLVEDVTSK